VIRVWRGLFLIVSGYLMRSNEKQQKIQRIFDRNIEAADEYLSVDYFSRNLAELRELPDDQLVKRFDGDLEKLKAEANSFIPWLDTLERVPDHFHYLREEILSGLERADYINIAFGEAFRTPPFPEDQRLGLRIELTEMAATMETIFDHFHPPNAVTVTTTYPSKDAATISATVYYHRHLKIEALNGWDPSLREHGALKSFNEMSGFPRPQLWRSRKI